MTPDLAQAFGLSQTQGAVITGVQPGSPAAKAGLEAGDIVLAVNARRIKNSSDVRNAVGMLQIGDEVRVEVVHKGDTVTRTAEIAAPKISREEGKKIHPKLAGTLLADTAPTEQAEGVRIEKIHTSSYAFQAGLRPGDIIVMANREEVHNLNELKGAAGGRSQLLLNIQRGDGAFFLMLR
jgi:serine protease Do/serine protease DegQ